MTAGSLGFKTAASNPVAGSLDLAVARQGRLTRPVKTDSAGVMRLMRSLYLDDSGQVAYFIINPGGAYFGDKYELNVDVGPEAHLLLTGQGATRIYKTPDEPAVQHMMVTLAAGSRFEYVPDQVIAYQDARYRQFTKLTIDPDAQAFVADIVTPGWDPDDYKFTYAGMHLRTDVYSAAEAGLVCVDNVRIEPGRIGEAIHGIGYLEGATHMGSMLVLGAHTEGEYVEAVRNIVERYEGVKAGVTAGARRGISWVMVRALGNSTDELYRMVLDVNEYDRSVTTGQGRLDLRRY